MGEQWFLRMDGIDGESAADRHRGEIDIDSYTWGVTARSAQFRSGSGGGAARVAGRPDLADLVVTARISAASPQLAAACFTGRRIRNAELSGVRTGGDGGGDAFLVYELDDVMVTSVQHHDGPDEDPTEQVHLAYQRLRITYRPKEPDGSLGAPVVAEYGLDR